MSEAESVASVLAKAEYTMDDCTLAPAWMKRPHPELEGQTPLEAARTEPGARAVSDILDEVFFGLPV